MCLARSAHGLVPNHAVFSGPFAVHVHYDTAPTPEVYRRFPEGIGLPDQLQVWHVDEVDYTTQRKQGLQPGTVASGYGFLDSPDTEVIAGGINSKSPTAVALGRHASLFLWGFACEPARMTPSGQNAFLNAICYIQKFDHQQPLVRRIASGREWHVMRAMGDDAKLSQARAELGFVHSYGRRHEVDEDCKELALANRDLALLEHCIASLERGDDVDRATRLLRRYTEHTFDTAAQWRTWFTANRDRLFFSDVGGFRWFTNVDRDAELRQFAIAAALEPVDDDRPARASAFVSTATGAPGAVITLAVRLRHASGWHSYLHTADGSAYLPTRLELTLPDGWNPVGGWSAPTGTPLPGEPGTSMATGDAVWLRRVRIGADAAAGAAELGVKLGYMVCDDAVCLPPETLQVTATVTVETTR